MNCIVSFANSNGNYIKGLARLAESLRNNFDGDLMAFTSEESIGAPKHKDNPYAFKVYAIQKAIDAGYKNILYLDASVFAIKNVQPVFDEIEREGFFAQEAGHVVGSWCNDETLSYFNLAREQANEMLMYGNAGMLGLDINSEKGSYFFSSWKHCMSQGLFKGSWDNHRHDMSVGSILANLHGLAPLFKKGNEWLQYAGLYDETANDTIIFKAQGV